MESEGYEADGESGKCALAVSTAAYVPLYAVVGIQCSQSPSPVAPSVPVGCSE